MARVAKKTKKTTIPRKSKHSKIAEEVKVGTETVNWDGVKDLDSAMRDTLRHYGYFYDYKDANKWVRDWAKKNLPKKDQRAISSIETWRTSVTLGGLCKMEMNGAPLPIQQRAWLVNNITGLVDIANDRKEVKKEIVDSIVKRSPADIVKERTSDFIAELESFVDDYDPKTHKKSMEISVYTMLTKVDAAYNTAKAVVDYYTPIYKELSELVLKKTPDLVEAYSHMKPTDQKKFREFIKNIVTEAEKYQLAKKAARKPIAKKVKSTGSQVASVKYMKTFDTLKIVSQNPEKIVGSTVVFLYNTKYKTISRLETSSSSGFEVKGTTVQNVDLELSGKKTLRKPEEMIATFTAGNAKKLERSFKALKTKAQSTTGRINADTIILRIF